MTRITEDNNLVALHKLDVDMWQQDRRLWDKTGMAPVRQLWLDRGWFQNYQHYRWGVGDGGFMGETGGYAEISSWYPSVYASMYPNFFGRTVSAHPDVTHIMPRQIMQSVYPAGGDTGKGKASGPVGNPSACRLNSTLTLNPRWLACHFGIIPDRYKPSALWVWNYLTGVKDEASIPNAIGTAAGKASGASAG